MYSDEHILGIVHSAGGYNKRFHSYAEAVDICMGDGHGGGVGLSEANLFKSF
jgi:hypothetical protein